MFDHDDLYKLAQRVRVIIPDSLDGSETAANRLSDIADTLDHYGDEIQEPRDQQLQSRWEAGYIAGRQALALSIAQHLGLETILVKGKDEEG